MTHGRRSTDRGLRLHGWLDGPRARVFPLLATRSRFGSVPGWDQGATTAEFAIVTMAAVGFAGLLVIILRSDGVRATLEGLVSRALNTAG